MKSWPHFAKKSSFRDGWIKTIRITINGHFTNDAIYTEVVARLENDDIAFGFVLRVGDDNLPSRLAMLSLLKDAYFHNRQVVVSYNITEGKKNGHLRRVEIS
jgi:hypothetical protein